MLPKNENISDIELIKYPTHTYQLDFNKRRIAKYTQDIEAMKQFVYKTLMTDRYRHEIYSWSYGFEMDDLIGKPATIVKAKLPGRIKDALIADDRVLDVDNFSFPEPSAGVAADKRTTVCVNFTVTTIFGNIDMDITKAI